MRCRAGSAGRQRVPSAAMADARDPAALLTDLPAAAAAVASGRMSSAALVGACLARIDEIEPRVRAFSYVDAKGARRRARDADARIAAGGALGPLHGVPV